jgi:hypothetical protein
MWTEIATSLRERPDVLLQNYIVGLGGGEVDPPLIELVLDDFAGRECAEAPIFFPREVATL